MVCFILLIQFSISLTFSQAVAINSSGQGRRSWQQIKTPPQS